MREAGQRGAVLLLICLSLGYGTFVLRKHATMTFTMYDPGWMIRTVISIAEDGDLDLRNQLDGDPYRAADQTARGKNGEWYPLHEYLMPVLTVPFFMLLGIGGCLVFNVVVLILLMLTLHSLCLRHADSQSAFTAVALTALASLFADYSYSYSLDVFGALVLIVAYSFVVRHCYILGGLFWGLAVYARLSNVVTLFGFLVFLIVLGCDTYRCDRSGSLVSRIARSGTPLVRFASGGLPIAACFLLANWHMFGSPLVTSYDRWQHFVDGRPVLSTLRFAFSCSFVEQLPKILLDTQSGLLIGAPLIVVAIGYGMSSLWREARNEATLMILVCLAQIVLFSRFCVSFPGSPGNRYLMSVVALSAVPLAMALRNCFQRHSDPDRGAGITSPRVGT